MTALRDMRAPATLLPLRLDAVVFEGRRPAHRRRRIGDARSGTANGNSGPQRRGEERPVAAVPRPVAADVREDRLECAGNPWRAAASGNGVPTTRSSAALGAGHILHALRVAGIPPRQREARAREGFAQGRARDTRCPSRRGYFPAASSNVLPWRACGRSVPRCCFSTNPRRASIRVRRMRSSGSSPRCTPRHQDRDGYAQPRPGATGSARKSCSPSGQDARARTGQPVFQATRIRGSRAVSGRRVAVVAAVASFSVPFSRCLFRRCRARNASSPWPPLRRPSSRAVRPSVADFRKTDRHQGPTSSPWAPARLSMSRGGAMPTSCFVHAGLPKSNSSPKVTASGVIR